MKFLRRLWRWVFFPLVCLVTLIALIMAEENLRGKLAWESCKRDLEAQGEHLEMAWFIPPPVPDDQNFAMYPPLKLLFSDLTGADPLTIRHAIRLEGRLSIADGRDQKVVFVSRKKGTWRTGESSDLEAWQRYYRAVFPKLALKGSAPEDILTATDQLADIFAELREGVKRRRSCRYDIHYEKGMDTPFPQLGPLQELVRILSFRATAELRLGRTGDAFDDVQLAFYLINSIRDEPFAISGWVRIGETGCLMGPIWEGIATHRWTDEQLTELQKEFQHMDWLSDYCFEIRGDRAMGYQLVQMYVKYPGMSRNPFSKSVQMMLPWMKVLPWLKFLPGWMYQNLVTECRWLQESILSMDPKTQRVDVPRILREKEDLESEQSTPYNFLARLIIVHESDPIQEYVIAQVWTNEAIIACEIERYRLAHGTLPASLDDLHVTNLPHDVINGEPLHYRVTGPDSYILYSVGWNGTDDGGKVVTNGHGSIDFTKGDWVWLLQPVEQER